MKKTSLLVAVVVIMGVLTFAYKFFNKYSANVDIQNKTNSTVNEIDVTKTQKIATGAISGNSDIDQEVVALDQFLKNNKNNDFTSEDIN